MPPDVSAASGSQVLPIFAMGDLHSNYGFGPLLSLKSAEMKDKQQEKDQKNFCFIRNSENTETARHRTPIQPSPTLGGELYQQYVETTVGS